MRKAFIDTLVKLSENDDRIYLLTADMGRGLVEPFSDKYPERFINVGVAEQNMIGVATGLALSGKIPFVYSISNFPTLRCVEHIRNACYHNLNINIVAGGTGLTYGALGSSHHATEDISVMRSLPNMVVEVPSDSAETTIATKSIAKLDNPCYLRIGRADRDVTHLSKLKIGKAISLAEGETATIISMGWMMSLVIQAEEILNRQGIEVRVLNMHTIKPIDTEAILKAASETKAIITVEEHSIIGGLGSAVAEVLADNSCNVKFKRMGIPDKFCTNVGTHDELLEECRLTIDDIISEVVKLISKES